MRSFIGTLYRILCFLVFVVLMFSGASAGETPSHIDVFTSGQGGYHTYRIPVLITTKKGTLLSFCEGRKTSTIDDGDNDLLLRRSTDAGGLPGVEVAAQTSSVTRNRSTVTPQPRPVARSRGLHAGARCPDSPICCLKSRRRRRI